MWNFRRGSLFRYPRDGRMVADYLGPALVCPSRPLSPWKTLSSSSSSPPRPQRGTRSAHAWSHLATTGTSPSSLSLSSALIAPPSRLKKIKCLQPHPDSKCDACKAAKIPCKFKDRERYFAERSRAIAGPNVGTAFNPIEERCAPIPVLDVFANRAAALRKMALPWMPSPYPDLRHTLGAARAPPIPPSQAAQSQPNLQVRASSHIPAPIRQDIGAALSGLCDVFLTLFQTFNVPDHPLVSESGTRGIQLRRSHTSPRRSAASANQSIRPGQPELSQPHPDHRVHGSLHTKSRPPIPVREFQRHLEAGLERYSSCSVR